MKLHRNRLLATLLAAALLLSTLLVPAAAADPADQAPPEIPGYTQYTKDTLDLDKHYLIVTQSSDGALYALYAGEAGKSVAPGALTAANGTDTAVLTVADGAVTAAHLKDGGGKLELSALQFDVFSRSDGMVFKSNGLYLQLTAAMFADSASGLKVTADGGTYTISSSNRTLSFNKVGDERSSYPDAKYITDFWGPTSKADSFKIYLYASNTPVDAAPYKEQLSAAVTQAETQKEGDCLDGWADFTKALAEVKAVQAKADATVVELKEAIVKLEAATDALVIKPVPAAPPEGATIIDGRGAPESGTTADQPFSSGTAGSEKFRIPAIITLSDGTLVAACDARWNHSGDACALDTIVSISKDNGKTWSYSFPNYFNDSTDAKHSQATAFIDPLMISGKDDTIYLMVDLFPGGIALNTAPKPPHAATGYVEIGGKQRLAVYTQTADQNDDNYYYYVGDFSQGYAPILEKNGDAQSGYFVDEHYNLYHGAKKDKVYCQQLGSESWVQQNLFYYNADLHVRNATYLWLVKSTDKGKTWSAPQILNPQVRPAAERTHQFYGVGPGAGLCLEDGTIMLPCYTFRNNDGRANSEQIASFVWSKDGVNWTRSDDATINDEDHGKHWSSESALVQIDATTVRHFYRDGLETLHYTDHTYSDGAWHAGEAVDTGVPNTWNNQLSAIRYSKPINGKTAILVSTAASGSSNRTHGRIFTFLLNEDKTMTLGATFAVTDGKYGYSSLTELKDGSIGLLYESDDAVIDYVNYPILDVAMGLAVGSSRSVDVPLYGTFSHPVEKAPTQEELNALDASIVKAEVKGNTVTYSGLKEGTTSYVSGGITVTVTVAPVNITEIGLNIGESRSFDIDSAALDLEPDPAIVSAVIASTDHSKTKAGILGYAADANGFTKQTVPLAKALFRFDKAEGENEYVISAKAPDGSAVYLSVDGSPCAAESAALTLEKVESTGDFAFKSGGNYLYCYRNGTLSYTRVGTLTGYNKACSFQFYRPAKDGETASADLPGFVKINELSELESGQSYLIGMKAGLQEYQFIRPGSAASSGYLQLLKLAPIVTHKLTVTWKGMGVTDVFVDDMIYRCTAYLVVTEPTATVSDGKATAAVTEEAGKALVEDAVKHNSPEAYIRPAISGSVDAVEVTLPASVVDGLGKQTEACLKLDTPVAMVSIPNTVLDELAGAPLKVTVSHKDNAAELSLVSGDKAVSGLSAAVTVTLPVEGCKPGVVAVIVSADGQRQVVRGSVSDGKAGTLRVPLTGSAKLELVDNGKTFSDVPGTNWAADAVAFVSSRELFQGVGDDEFAPSTAMTRGMLAVVLHNLEYNPASTGAARFPDAVGSWYSDAVAWAAEKNVVTGYPDGTFAPKTPITREQLAVMLWRYAGQPAAADGASDIFTDSDKISGYAAEAVNWAVSQGILNGMGDDILDPRGPATRAQVAQMLMNFMRSAS